MNYFKRLETIFIALVILVLGVAYGMMSDSQYPLPQDGPEQAPAASGTQPTELPESVRARYEGVEGRTALELLKASYRVETQSFGDLGEFVKSIDGVEPDSRHFWAFYLNGQQSQEGAGSYVTKASDMVEWRLEEIK
jgi:hypothetical protein